MHNRKTGRLGIHVLGFGSLGRTIWKFRAAQLRAASLDSGRCRSNMAHARQSRPDSGLGVHVKAPQHRSFPLRSAAVLRSKQFSIQAKMTHITVQWFQGRLVLKARTTFVSLNSRFESHAEEEDGTAIRR